MTADVNPAGASTERPRGGLPDARAPEGTERPRGGLPDARAPEGTERPRGGLPDARAPESTAVLPRYQRPEGVHPPLNTPEYRSSALRAPARPLIPLPQGLTEITGPLLGGERVTDGDADLTSRHPGEPLGERIIVTGRVLDSDGRPVPDTLVEIWQANSAGRYRHPVDDHQAPLDPNFDGAGRCVTDSQGRYRFVTIKPGPYPWRNHRNAWRPAHIHFSLFGRAFTQRLVTQMYFPGDPLFSQDPIFNSVPDSRARERMIARFDLGETVPEWALGYEWDIVLRGSAATVFETQEKR